MKKALIILLLLFAFIKNSTAQNQTVVGPAQKALTDTICGCVSKIDLSKITNKNDAMTAYTDCITQHADMLVTLAKERNVEMDDMEGMKKVGVDIALNLMKNNCPGFAKLAVMMAKNEDGASDDTGSSSGILKRIDNKGFNYFAIVDDNGSEKSFIWLREFPGSEKFTNGLTGYTGKKVKIKWDEIEVYLPAAKGYYKVKEVTQMTFVE